MTNFSPFGNAIIFNISAVGPQGPAGAPGMSGQTFSAITPVTASQAVSASLSGTLFSNVGATGEVDISLPPSTIFPLTFSLYIGAAQTGKFIVPAGVTIYNGTDTSSSGGSISSNTVGNLVTLTLLSPTQWIVTSIVGIWSLN